MDESKYPNWFSAPKTFWNEARRNDLLRQDTPEHIFHYTSLEGFVGIIESRTIWLTDYAYLNDTRELSHGIGLIRGVIADMLKDEPEESIQSLLNVWDRDIGNDKHRVCIASFSADGDSLSQWRSYGPIALGFEPHDLALHANRADLRPVEYDRDRQRNLVRTYLHHLCQAYTVDLSDNRLQRIPDIYHKTDRLIQLIAFFKDPSFSGENEYRLAYIEYPDLIESFDIAPSPKRFRISHSRLQPYVMANELVPTQPNHPPLNLSKVVLGPEADSLLERGIREFLNDKMLVDVEVCRSTVPYRT